MRERANRHGSIDCHRDAWRVRVYVEGKRRTLGTYPTRERAESVLGAYLASRGEGVLIAPSETTLGGFGLEWLDLRELDGSDDRAVVKDIGNERSVFRRHVEPAALAAMPIDTIATQHVETYARWLRRRPKVSTITTLDGPKHRETGETISRSTQKHALRIVRAILEAARKRGIIDANPAEGVKVSPDAGSARDLSDDWLREDEIGQLLECEKLSRLDRRAHACAIGLALRVNDLLSVSLDAVRLDCAIPGPHVVVQIGKKGQGAKLHRVPIMPWLAPIIEEQIASLPAGARWLFPTREGLKHHKSHDFGWAEKVDRRLKVPRTPGALERAGIARRVRFHDLRGTTATHLALGTWGRAWSLHEIQTMLAHSDQRVTERYVRRAMDMLAEAARGTAAGPRWSGGITKTVTSPEGFEPSTFGSGGPRAPESSRGDSYHGDQRGTSASIAEAARAVLTATTPESVEAFVSALEGAAASIREAGPHAARRAIELAEAVLARAATDDAARAAGGA